MLEGINVGAIELSALRRPRTAALAAFAKQADLSRFSYVSVHSPRTTLRARKPKSSRYSPVSPEDGPSWPIRMSSASLPAGGRWDRSRYIENMDKRTRWAARRISWDVGLRRVPRGPDVLRHRTRPAGRHLADGSLSNPEGFHRRIQQIHISVVNTSSKHDLISPGAAHSFRRVASLIPCAAPAILETPVKTEQIREQLDLAAAALDGASCR